MKFDLYEQATKNMALKSRALVFLLMKGWDSSSLQKVKVSEVRKDLEEFSIPLEAVFKSGDEVAFAYPSKRPWPISRIVEVAETACRNAGVESIDHLRG